MGEEEMIIGLGNRQPSDVDIARAIRRNVGSMLYVSEMAKEIRKDMPISVGVKVERHLFDAESNEFMVKFLQFKKVFNARLDYQDMNYRLILPTRKEIIDQANSKLVNYRMGSETALLKAIGSRVIDVAAVRNQMTPIFEIVETVTAKESVIAMDFVTPTRSLDKSIRYLEFLRDVDVVVKEGEKYYPGPVVKEFDTGTDKAGIYRSIVSETLRKGYTYMADFLHFTLIMPYLKLGNSSFLPSFHADKILKMTPKDICCRQLELYGDEMKESKVLHKANEMTEIKVFENKGSFYFGHSPVFEEYKENWKKKSFVIAS